MKVLVGGTAPEVGGGIARLTDLMVAGLRARGHEVERVATDAAPRDRPNRLNVQNVARVTADAVGLVRAGRASRPDVVWLHVTGVPLLPALRALLVVVAGRALRRPVVLQLHAAGLDQAVRGAGRSLRAVLWLLGRASSMVVVLHDDARAALAGLVPPARVHVLANFVDVPSVAVPLPDAPPWRVVFVGTLSERKGVPQLLDALRRLDASVVATIVGGPGEEGPEWSASLREGAADLVAAGRVSFPGELAPDEVGAELRRAHLFVLPSRAEGTPLALLEAMAVGRPVVVGDAGNVRQVVAAAGCGDVLDERTPDALAAAIRRALADPAALARHGAAAHASALAEHATDARMSEVEALLAAAEARR